MKDVSPDTLQSTSRDLWIGLSKLAGPSLKSWVSSACLAKHIFLRRIRMET